MTQFETRSADWLSVPDALSRVLGAVRPLSKEEVQLQDALGRALADPVLARATLPPWDNSAMDGYAVRHRDLEGASPNTPVVLSVVGEVKAGATAQRSLGSGEAIRIMTGAPVPTGADAVVRVEDTDSEATAGHVEIRTSPPAGKDIRPGGQDMKAGETILEPGASVGAGQIGLLAASGIPRIPVRRRPRVALLSNGDEIASSDEFHRVLAAEAVPETNSPTLAAAVAAMGGIPLPLGIARDNPESIVEKIQAAREAGADALVTSGGASMGEFDLFKRVLDGMGFRLDFWRVKMRPGTPFSFGVLPGEDGGPDLPVFGLPGNPASSFVTFQIFCRPFLLALAGHERIHRPVMMAETSEAMRSPSRLTHFFRVTLTGDPASPKVGLTGSQTSGLVRGQGLARALAVVPEGVDVIEEGQPIRVILLDDFGVGGAEPGFLP
jgi:molybdopterin molybdotransferase